MTDARRPADLTCDDVRESAGAFVLDALDDDEAAAVRAHLASCTDAHAEIQAAADALPVLDASVPQVEPPAGLKGRIMAAAAADLATRRASSGAVAAEAGAAAPAVEAAAAGREAEGSARGSAVPIPFPVAARPSRTRTGWLAAIAAALAIVLLGTWNLSLQRQLGAAQTYSQQVATVLAIAGKPGSLSAVLTSTTGQGLGVAAIDASGTMTVAMRDLPALSGSSVYEAWMIAPGGPPVPLGAVAVTQDGIGSMQGSGIPAEAGLVIAFTREPGPGATTPTLPIVSSGTAAKSG